MENDNLKNDDILEDFINIYKNKSFEKNEKYSSIIKENISNKVINNEKTEKENFISKSIEKENNFIYTSSKNLNHIKYHKEAAYELIKDNTVLSRNNSIGENPYDINSNYNLNNNFSKLTRNRKSSDKNDNYINNNLNTYNSQEGINNNESSFNNNISKLISKGKNSDDSANFIIADEMKTFNKINNMNNNKNTSFVKNNLNNNDNLNNINNNIIINKDYENQTDNTSHHNNFNSLNISDKNILTNQEMTFNANNNSNNYFNGNNNNKYISDILSQMKIISEKQNFILEKIKIVEDNSGNQFFQMNSRIEKLENAILQLMTNNMNINLSNIDKNDYNINNKNHQYLNSNYNISFGTKTHHNNIPSQGQVKISNVNSNGSVNANQNDLSKYFIFCI